MNDHELFPAPPVEPLDDATRARLRARVVDGLDDAETRRPRSRWAVPAAAAAAVLVVAGVTAGLVLRGDPEAPGGTLDPAGSGSPSASVPPSGVEPVPDADPDPRCAPEVRAVLPGAPPVTTTASETGTTTFYVAGGMWTLCSTHGGRATVHEARALDARPDRAAYRVSSLFTGRSTSTFVSGGVLPEGLVRGEVTYRFPDGHTQPARVVVDDAGRTWWEMEYTVTGGPMNTGSSLRLEPIEVDVVTEQALRGRDETFTLDWGTDTCRQVNHGC